MTSSKRAVMAAVVLILTLFSLVNVGHALTPAKSEKVNRLVRKLMRCAQIPALSLSLVGLDDRSLYYQAYGNADIDSGERAHSDTRFCLGGATEAFTAVLLAKLMQGNENVTWSTPVEEIVGHRVILPDNYRSSNLNLMDILAKRTGLPTMDIVTVAKPYSVNRLTRNFRYVTPVSGFREKYVPNQVLFSLLEEVVKDLGGDSWEMLLKKHILEPLEMNSVMFLGDKEAVSAANVATPVVMYDKKPQALSLESLKGLSLIKPAASLCLSAADMSKWIRFLMRGKDAKGQQLLDMDTLQETFVGVQGRGHGDDPEMVGYRQPEVQVSYAREQNALGWITGHYRGYKFVSQDGSIPGYQTLSTILPERNVAVSVSFTGEGGSKGVAAKILLNQFGLDVLLRGNTWFDDTDVCSIMGQMRGQHTQNDMATNRDVHRSSKYQGERSLDDFVGYYRNYVFGDVLVKHNETEDPDLVMEYGQAVYKMAPTDKNNTFQLIAKGLLWYTTNADNFRSNRLIVVFSEDERDPEGRINQVTISGFDRNADVVFHTNPVPPRYGMPSADCHCGASSMTSSVSWLSALIMAVCVFVR